MTQTAVRREAHAADARAAKKLQDRRDDPVRRVARRGASLLQPRLLRHRHQERPAPEGAQPQARASTSSAATSASTASPSGGTAGPASKAWSSSATTKRRSRVVAKEDGRLVVRTPDSHLGTRRSPWTPTLVVLTAGIEPQKDNRQLSQLLKVPLEADGFFLEAHVKLRPVDFATEGVFVCGLAHYPKDIGESIAQARAAAARAATILSSPRSKPRARSPRSRSRCAAGAAPASSFVPTRRLSWIPCSAWRWSTRPPARGAARAPPRAARAPSTSRGSATSRSWRPSTRSEGIIEPGPDRTRTGSREDVGTQGRGVPVQLVFLRRGGPGGRQPHPVSRQHPHRPGAVLRPDQPGLPAPRPAERGRRRARLRMPPGRLPLHQRQPGRPAEVRPSQVHASVRRHRARAGPVFVGLRLRGRRFAIHRREGGRAGPALGPNKKLVKSL